MFLAYTGVVYYLSIAYWTERHKNEFKDEFKDK